MPVISRFSMFLCNGLVLVELSFCKQEWLTDHCCEEAINENIKNRPSHIYIYILSETQEKLIILSLPG